MIGAGSLLSALGVILGAFGAHALKARLEPHDLATFETGVRYHLIHALALVLVGVLAHKASVPNLRVVGWAFGAGILVFSGSLYVLVLSGQRWLGAVTPIGGLAFIFGWLYLAYLALKTPL